MQPNRPACVQLNILQSRNPGLKPLVQHRPKDKRQSPKPNWKLIRFRVWLAFTVLWVFLVGALTFSASPLMVHRTATPAEIASCLASHPAADALDRVARELSCKVAPSADLRPNYGSLLLAALAAFVVPALVFVVSRAIRRE
jgi:hypothetical protein